MIFIPDSRFVDPKVSLVGSRYMTLYDICERENYIRNPKLLKVDDARTITSKVKAAFMDVPKVDFWGFSQAHTPLLHLTPLVGQ